MNEITPYEKEMVAKFAESIHGSTLGNILKKMIAQSLIVCTCDDKCACQRHMKEKIS